MGMKKQQRITVRTLDKSGESLEQFLIRELSEYYIDVIELEWDMSLQEFIRTYIRINDYGMWCSLI